MTRSKDSGSADYLARLRQYPRLSGGLEHEKVRSLAERLELCDTSWDAQTEDCRSGRLMEVVKSLSPNPEDAVLRAEATSRTSLAVLRALSTLDVRERYLVERRLMADLEEQLSLAEIGRRFCVSRERARQIEARAIRRLRAALAGSGANAEWLAPPLAARAGDALWVGSGQVATRPNSPPTSLGKYLRQYIEARRCRRGYRAPRVGSAQQRWGRSYWGPASRQRRQSSKAAREASPL